MLGGWGGSGGGRVVEIDCSVDESLINIDSVLGGLRIKGDLVLIDHTCIITDQRSKHLSFIMLLWMVTVCQ